MYPIEQSSMRFLELLNKVKTDETIIDSLFNNEVKEIENIFNESIQLTNRIKLTDNLPDEINDNLDENIPDFDFDNCINMYDINNIILGKTNIFVYESIINEIEIEWHMCANKTENDDYRYWIDRIIPKHNKITTWGVHNFFINSGFLTASPIKNLDICSDIKKKQYIIVSPIDRRITDSLPDNINILPKTHKIYCLITNFLAGLKPIKMFKEKHKDFYKKIEKIVKKIFMKKVKAEIKEFVDNVLNFIGK